MISYSLIRSNRKSIGIYITGDAAVVVRAPFAARKAEIDRIVASKQEWIEKNLLIRSERLELKAVFSLNYGGHALLMGSEYPICERKRHLSMFDGAAFYLPPGLPPEKINGEITRIYKETAKNAFAERVRNFSEIMGLYPSSVKITSAKTRWGSCGGKDGQKNVCFSWRLIMAEGELIDYVIVHELAHIKEHNHSERFWKIVESVLPDYAARRARLGELAKKLACENWD